LLRQRPCALLRQRPYVLLRQRPYVLLRQRLRMLRLRKPFIRRVPANRTRRSSLHPSGYDLSMRSFARFGMSNFGRPTSFQTSSAFIMISRGGSENVPGSIFCVASMMILLP
jgi:hypothetical protein